MNMIRIRKRHKDEIETALIEETDVYAKWWTDFATNDLRAIYEHFGIEVFRRSSCLDGFARFLAANGFHGKRCVEIGTCKGLTAIVLARLFDEVVTFDLEPDPMKRELAAFCGITNIRFFDIADNADKAKVIGGLDFDAAYCDGNHSHDTQSDFDLVAHTGRVLFHEYWPLQPAVWEMVNGLRNSGTVVSHGNYALWKRH